MWKDAIGIYIQIKVQLCACFYVCTGWVMEVPVGWIFSASTFCVECSGEGIFLSSNITVLLRVSCVHSMCGHTHVYKTTWSVPKYMVKESQTINLFFLWGFINKDYKENVMNLITNIMDDGTGMSQHTWILIGSDCVSLMMGLVLPNMLEHVVTIQ